MIVPVALLMTVLAQTPSSPEPTATAPRAAALLFVMDVGGDHVPPADRQSLTESLSLVLARRLDLDVQSPRSLMDRVNFAEQQQQAGCDSSACLAEIANAMGARFVLFSRVVKLGDDEVLRADVYDNGAGRSVALATVQAGSASELLRRVPELVDSLIAESHGELPLRAVERPVGAPPDAPMSANATTALIIGGVGLGATVVGGGLFAAGLVQIAAVNNAANAYADTPDIDNARAVIDARGAIGDDVVTLGTCGSGILGLGGLITLIVGGGLFAVDAIAPEAEPAP